MQECEKPAMKKQSTDGTPRKAREVQTHRQASSTRLVKFPQAKGRTVEKVELSLDPEFHCVSIRFKDNTDLTVIIDAALIFQAVYSEWKAGDQKILKRWPVVRSNGL